jgi:hypothetical protein
MKKYKTRFVIISSIVLFLIYSVPNLGQTKSSNSIDQYLDDGGRTMAENLVKTNISEIFTGNIPIYWEHRFDNHFTLECSMGLLTNFLYNPPIDVSSFTNFKMNNALKAGYSVSIAPKNYFQAFESFYSGVCYKFQCYPGQVYSNEFYVFSGRQWLINGYWVVDIGIGLGFNFENSIDGVSYIYTSKSDNDTQRSSFGFHPVLPIILKIGYRI